MEAARIFQTHKRERNWIDKQKSLRKKKKGCSEKEIINTLSESNINPSRQLHVQS